MSFSKLAHVYHDKSSFRVLTHDGDARDDPRKKMILYFTVEFRSCLDLFSTSIALRTCSSLICNARVQFQKNMRKISLCSSRCAKYAKFSHFTLLGSLRKYADGDAEENVD